VNEIRPKLAPGSTITVRGQVESMNIAFNKLGLGLIFAALLIFIGGLKTADAMLLVAIYFIVLQFMIMVAVTLLFSTFSTPIFSAIFAFALFVIGTFGEDLKNFAAMSHGATKWLATAAAYVMPNFASLNVIAQVAHEQGVGAHLVIFNTVYAVLYSVAVTAAAVLIFERRNLK